MPAIVIRNALSPSTSARTRYPTSTRYPNAASNSRVSGSNPAFWAASLAVTSVAGLPAANSSNARRSWSWLPLRSLSMVVCHLSLRPSPAQYLTSLRHRACHSMRLARATPWNSLGRTGGAGGSGLLSPPSGEGTIPTRSRAVTTSCAQRRCVFISRRGPPLHCSRGVGLLRRKLVVLQTVLLGLQTFESLRDQRWRRLTF